MNSLSVVCLYKGNLSLDSNRTLYNDLTYMVSLLMAVITNMTMAIIKPDVYDNITTTSMVIETASGSCFQSGQRGKQILKFGSRKKSSRHANGSIVSNL